MITHNTPKTDVIFSQIRLANHPETDGDHFRAFMESAKNGVELLERQRDEAITMAGELVAIIRVNAMHGTWAEATPEQVDEFLVPWVEKLRRVCVDE